MSYDNDAMSLDGYQSEGYESDDFARVVRNLAGGERLAYVDKIDNLRDKVEELEMEKEDLWWLIDDTEAREEAVTEQVADQKAKETKRADIFQRLLNITRRARDKYLKLQRKNARLEFDVAQRDDEIDGLVKDNKILRDAAKKTGAANTDGTRKVIFGRNVPALEIELVVCSPGKGWQGLMLIPFERNSVGSYGELIDSLADIAGRLGWLQAMGTKQEPTVTKLVGKTEMGAWVELDEKGLMLWRLGLGAVGSSVQEVVALVYLQGMQQLAHKTIQQHLSLDLK